MPKNSKAVPDAWDDDWESLADKAEKEQPDSESQPREQAPKTRAERLAKHAEEQRKLWEAAEAPEEPKFLPIANDVPLATPFKPTMKLLSRKPAPKMIARRDPVTGLEQMTIQDDDDEEDESKKNQPTPEEMERRRQQEQEEKLRRYNEIRAQLWSEPNPSSGQSTPGSVTPPQQAGSEGARQSNRGRGGRGRGRGGGRGSYGNQNGGKQHGSQSPARASTQQQPGTTRELYDPNYAPKPGSAIQRRGGGDTPPQSSRSATPRDEDQIIRTPRGPDATGRGFGSAKRGAKED
ncbi:hypothetical protein QBC37DRAFT_39172 [Rhypophila decipiens]|uniref:SUZ-C domain-containing protein n=1 Tax=Rhypophila decipiens TaxID=261697 RepID=A0AAN6YFH6_9PEZI|nr:hypothetical protein QBC37DRAFT_39172 [Rhypophila decipiens]